MARKRLDRKLLSTALIAVVLTGCTATAVATPEQDADKVKASYLDARSVYLEELDEYLQCLEEQGFKAFAELMPDGVFYSFRWDIPAQSSLEAWEEHNSGIDRAHEICSTRSYETAVMDLEEIIAPTDEDLRGIAATCAAQSGVSVSESADTELMLAEVARSGSEGSFCVFQQRSELINERFGDLGN